MAEVDEKKGAEPSELVESGAPQRSSVNAAGVDAGNDAVVEHLGVDKYVFAAFFGGGIGLSYLVGKLLTAFWSVLAEVPAVVKVVPQLLQYAGNPKVADQQVLDLVTEVARVQLPPEGQNFLRLVIANDQEDPTMRRLSMGNVGDAIFSEPAVTAANCSAATLASGDKGNDRRMEPGETWEAQP